MSVGLIGGCSRDPASLARCHPAQRSQTMDSASALSTHCAQTGFAAEESAGRLNNAITLTVHPPWCTFVPLLYHGHNREARGAMSYSTTIHNRNGDLTLAWDEPDDPKIIAMIEAQMARGFDFWMLEPRLGGMAAPHKVPLRQAADALRTRVVAMSLAAGEPDIAAAIEDRTVTPTSRPNAEPSKEPLRRQRVSKAKTAEEVAGGQSVRTTRRGGG